MKIGELLSSSLFLSNVLAIERLRTLLLRFFEAHSTDKLVFRSNAFTWKVGDALKVNILTKKTHTNIT